MEGALVDDATGVSTPLEGRLVLLPTDRGVPGLGIENLVVGNFLVDAGDHRFAPRVPLEFEGLTPIHFLEIANALQLREGQVSALWLRSGGHVAAAGGDTVTFRMLDLHAGAAASSVGERLPDGLPARFAVEGELIEADQTFSVRRSPCGLREPIALPPIGGPAGPPPARQRHSPDPS